MKRNDCQLAVWCLAVWMLASGSALADGFGPWSVDPRHPVMPEPVAVAPPPAPSGSDLFTLAYRVYAEFITRIDGPRCSHRPSCAAFAIQALRRYRLPVGLWLAVNRFLRGAASSAARRLPLLATAGGIYFLDTLEDNAFWEAGYFPISGR